MTSSEVLSCCCRAFRISFHWNFFRWLLLTKNPTEPSIAAEDASADEAQKSAFGEAMEGEFLGRLLGWCQGKAIEQSTWTQKWVSS